MPTDNLPLPMLQAVRRAQGGHVSAAAALKVMLPVGDMVDEIRKGTADARGLFALLEFFTFIYGAFMEALPKTADKSKPLLVERCKKVARAATLVHELLKKAKSGKRPAANLKELDELDEAYDIAVNAHEALPEWTFIAAYRRQQKYIQEREAKRNKR
jgi:hypothetical protein